MVHDITHSQLTSFDGTRRPTKPHVVILGAGASLAAFPSGDAAGRRLPLMANVVEVLGLTDAIRNAGFDPASNFESLYSSLHKSDSSSPLLEAIEIRVMEYFSSLRLPSTLTLYDLLLLSLRPKDAIFTFNWDPFLVDAYLRNHGNAPLPKIFHLHGNVRVAFCSQCGHAKEKAETCSGCGSQMTPSRLLYPVENKNYADDLFISSQWEQARDYIANAAMITIFGYSAPATDKAAMEIFTKAWKVEDEETRPVERVEIIDVRDGELLAQQWGPFAHFDHINLRRNFFDSWLALYPRRSIEALAHTGFDGHWVESIPWAGNLKGVTESIAALVDAEESNS